MIHPQGRTGARKEAAVARVLACDPMRERENYREGRAANGSMAVKLEAGRSRDGLEN